MAAAKKIKPIFNHNPEANHHESGLSYHDRDTEIDEEGLSHAEAGLYRFREKYNATAEENAQKNNFRRKHGPIAIASAAVIVAIAVAGIAFEYKNTTKQQPLALLPSVDQEQHHMQNDSLPDTKQLVFGDPRGVATPQKSVAETRELPDNGASTIDDDVTTVKAGARAITDSLQSLVNHVAAVEEENKRFVGQLATIKNETNKQLERKDEALLVAVRRSEDFADQLGKKDNEIEALKTSVSVIIEKQGALTDENTKLNDENDDLRRENGKLSIRVADLRTEAKESRVENKSTQEENTTNESIEPKPLASARKTESTRTVKLSSPKKESKTEKDVKSVAVESAAEPKRKKSRLDGLSVIGFTSDTIVAMKDGVPVTIAIGQAWNGVKFERVDANAGAVITSEGTLTISR